MPEKSTLDGIAAAPETPENTKEPAGLPADPAIAVSKTKLLLLFVGGIAYMAYALWCVALMSIYPSATASRMFLLIGLLVCAIAGIGFVGIGGLLLLRVSKSGAQLQRKKMALIKILAVTIPGILLSVVTPLLAMREPPLSIAITSPADISSLVAPASLTFSVEQAVATLRQNGFTPVQYRWDINSDGEIDQETLEPTLTATFEREGVHTVSVRMASVNGDQRVAARRFIISKAAFSVQPALPIVNVPVVFNLAGLYPEQSAITSIEWDFDGDGTIDQTGASTRASTTYFRTGDVQVRAVVQLSNNTQAVHERTITVQNPEPLPFPVEISTEPTLLVSTAPFTARFTIETETDVARTEWSFGDGEQGEGNSVAHTFQDNGSYAVQAKVYSVSGAVANLSTVVNIVDRLSINDLEFEGSHRVSGNRVTGEVPLSLSLTPTTSLPFITFAWEAPEATSVGSTETTLQATYRREGTYTATLIAQDAEGKVLRLPITVTVEPASSSVSFNIEPETGVAPLTVKLDASESFVPNDDITGFIWGFGDRSEQEVGGAFTQHVYQTAGTYVIDLTVRTAGGKQLTTTRTMTVRAPAFQACVLPSRIRGNAPLGVEFSSSCTTGNITSYLWDFGDGAQNSEEDPVHVFTRAGVYNVRLTVLNAAGQSSTTNVSITVE